MTEVPALRAASPFTVKQLSTGVISVRMKTCSRLFQDGIQALAVLWCMSEGHLEVDPAAYAALVPILLELAELDTDGT